MLGPYRVIERIGRGGMAEVYKAHHSALDRYVAIKVLPEFFADNLAFRERFRQEARSIARLNHPNILSVFDFGDQDGAPYLVMELLEGGTLADILSGPVDLEEVVRILRPLASALDYAHSHGILHRDLKPSNVLRNADGAPVLADFGLVKLAHSLRKLTASGTVLGTPEYMSPEQSAGEDIGPASDLYSLAVIAYEMLTGRVPFQADTPAAVLLSHLNKAVPPTRELVGELSAHLEGALQRGLAKRPEERYPSAARFVAALTPAAWIKGSRGGSTVGDSGEHRRVARGQRTPKVLVVDDSAANRELIEACLAEVDCEVLLAADGVSAIEAVESGTT